MYKIKSYEQLIKSLEDEKLISEYGTEFFKVNIPNIKIWRETYVSINKWIINYYF